MARQIMPNWRACWDVFQAGMIMLAARMPPHLIAYADRIQAYNALFGPRCRALLYQTEVRFRREQLVRNRRHESEALDKAIRAGSVTDFGPGRPWNHMFS